MGKRQLRTSKFKSSKWFVPVILKIREGPYSRKELEGIKIEQGGASVKIGHAELSRVLSLLTEAKAIDEKDGKVYWSGYYQTYENQVEYEAHLNHSKILSKIVRPMLIEKREPLSKDSRRLFDCFLQHLKTGYPEEHNLYAKMVSTRSDLKAGKEKFLKEVAQRARNLPRIRDADDVARVVYDGIKDLLRGKPSSELKINRGVLMWGTHGLAEDGVEGVRKFIEEEWIANLNTKTCKNLMKFENEYIELETEVETEVTRLMSSVESGTPLIGRCDDCPRIRLQKT